MEKLLQGINHFQGDVFWRYEHIFQGLAKKQTPLAMVITCSDSRVDPSLMMQTDPGDLFVCRNAGNIAPPCMDEGGVAASVEYAIEALKIRSIIICGHSDCGAMKAILNPHSTDNLPAVKNWLRHAEISRGAAGMDDNPDEQLRRVTEKNVLVQLENLRAYPSVKKALARGELDLYGWVYEIATGEIRVFEPLDHRFIAFSGTLPVMHATA